jgi:hypothetical protein
VKPVYWKPKQPTRVMHERAAAKRQLAREEALRREPRGEPFWRRFLARLRGNG